MTKWRRALLVVALLSVFSGLLLWPSPPTCAKSLEAATSQAGVAATDNKVDKMPKGATGWNSCQVGDILRAGDKIRTGPDSSASLLLADQSVMRLGHNTEIQIVDLTEQEDGSLVRRFQLNLGRVFSDVTPSGGKPSVFEVKGPNAAAAVRGTAFEMDAGAESGDTDVKVWDGSVECQSHKEGAKPELIQAGAENHFKVNRQGVAQRLRFVREHADPWQVENLETRKRWRQMAARMPHRLSLTPANLQRFNQARHRLTPQQKQQILKHLQESQQQHNHPPRHQPQHQPQHQPLRPRNRPHPDGTNPH